jgi:hypothetical protein
MTVGLIQDLPANVSLINQKIKGEYISCSPQAAL